MSVAVASPRECGARAALRWTADEASANRFDDDDAATVAVEVEAMGEERRALDERASVRCILFKALRSGGKRARSNQKKAGNERRARESSQGRPQSPAVIKSNWKNEQWVAYAREMA